MGLLGTSHQLGQGDAIHPCEPVNCSQSWALYASLDRAQLRSIDAESLVDVELRQSSLISDLAQDTSQRPFRA